MWHLIEAAQLASKLEPIAIKHGFHIALGGSTLHVGISEKDLDLFFYQRTPKGLGQLFQRVDFLPLLEELTDYGLILDDDLYGSGANGDDDSYKHVHVAEYHGKRIDCIFLQPPYAPDVSPKVS